ncbi:DUF6691 family protein [Photobacterium minamisatsumaniensis]|uniref:DUF6691 family protein n=1 Tax=Photobacterium minamisatsumaniensis TaxID=2910233 RepID=UPI003D13234E
MASKIMALISGLLFGLGMMVSGMVDPHRVIGFLDIAGNWDPSLAFVMGGALAVFMPSYFLLIKPREKPICEAEFKVATHSLIDRPLVIGAGLFGLGWGIAGICPGPAVTSVAGLNPSMLMFIAAMLIGMFAADMIKKKRE